MPPVSPHIARVGNDYVELKYGSNVDILLTAVEAREWAYTLLRHAEGHAFCAICCRPNEPTPKLLCNKCQLQAAVDMIR
jgi:hypothetical protein